MPRQVAERKCALYRIMHIASGRDYVGISVNYKERWKQHKRESAQGKLTCPKFYRTLAKYGPEAFTWNVIAWARNYACAGQLERMARHLGLGQLNCTMGGEGVVGRIFSPETLAKMSESQRGIPRKKHTPETKAQMSASHMGRPKSAEHGANISKAKKGVPRGETSREARKNLSISGKAYNESLREAGIVIRRSEEVRARMSASALARYDRVRAENGGKVPPPHNYSPECRAKMRATKAANKAAKNK